MPEPGAGQVLVKVAGAGACHSDLHIMQAPAPLPGFTDPPFTLGHENAGWVERLGPGVTGFEPGDPVIVYGSWGCGICANCRQGQENYCQKRAGEGPGLRGGHDGGMAEYLLVPAARYLIPLGTLDPRQAAPLSDAGLTGYHAVKRSLHLLGPGSTAVVIGAGGLGQMTIQILRALSAATTVVAVDTDAGKLENAQRLGAEEALLSGDEAIARIRDMTEQQGAQLVLDMVGIDATLRMAARSRIDRTRRAATPHHLRGPSAGEGSFHAHLGAAVMATPASCGALNRAAPSRTSAHSSGRQAAVEIFGRSDVQVPLEHGPGEGDQQAALIPGPRCLPGPSAQAVPCNPDPPVNDLSPDEERRSRRPGRTPRCACGGRLPRGRHPGASDRSAVSGPLSARVGSPSGRPPR
ncbi:alcohol dehydrogenase catalytic domain-containing protein [Streptomyces sp. NPDC046759]|uniref:alcohol dehydrogenase catalytic domain-containing protein n=1 Tax=Streptomyces sp. NPDC046759 TaxID=3155019 RepID=UPI003401C575